MTTTTKAIKAGAGLLALCAAVAIMGYILGVLRCLALALSDITGLPL